MATETNIEQYIDINGLRQLLNLIKQTYVCQKGLTSKVREQIYDILETIGSSVTVQKVFGDNRTDPEVIASEKFPEYKWKNGDLLCVENTDGHMSVFYWNNALWICVSKAPVNNIDINDTEENLKKIIPTAAAVTKIIDKKIDSALGNFTPGTGGSIDIGIATEDKAGIVRASDEISVDPLSGLMTVQNIFVGKISGIDEKIKSIAYTKEEVNHIILSGSNAASMATITAKNINDLNNNYKGEAIGTIAIIEGTSDVYILNSSETEPDKKAWEILKDPNLSLTRKIEELENKSNSSGTWENF